MRRFDAQYRAMKEAVGAGAIGAPLIFQSVHRNPSVPGHYTKDMALTDTAVHDIDVARYLLDDEPVAISVKVPRKNSRGGALSDPLFTLIEMRSGALVAIETSVNIAYGYDIRGELIGETGVVTLAERNDIVVRSNGMFSGRVPVDWRERFVAAFDAEFREWLAAATKGEAAGPSSWDGYVATVVTTTGVKAIESASASQSGCASDRRSTLETMRAPKPTRSGAPRLPPGDNAGRQFIANPGKRIAMKFALNHMVAPRLDCGAFFDLARKLGVTDVEIRNDLPGGALADGTRRWRSARKRRGGGNVSTINALQRFNLWDEARAREAESMIAQCAESGAQALILCPVNDVALYAC